MSPPLAFGFLTQGHCSNPTSRSQMLSNTNCPSTTRSNQPQLQGRKIAKAQH